jgi:hypothetical protein
MRQAYEAVLPAIGEVFQLWPSIAWDLNNRTTGVSDFRCHGDDITTGTVNGKPFHYQGNFIPTMHSQPPSAAPRLALWDENYSGATAQTPPAWTFLVYRLRQNPWKSPAGAAPPAAITDPLAVPPAPNGNFANDPNTGLPGPGFYTP